MLKSILNLEGVQGLSKNEQKGINGGLSSSVCPVPGTERACLRAGGFWYSPSSVCLYPTNYCL